MLDVKKYDEWIQSSRILQVRYISILTSILYIFFSQIDIFFVPEESLKFVQSIHLYLIALMLLFIAFLTFFEKYHKTMAYLLIFAPIGAALGNYLVLSKLNNPQAYLTEIYLIIFWIFTVSGLKFSQAVFSAAIVVVISTFSSSYLGEDEFILHMFWVFSVSSFGLLGAFLLEKSSKKIFLNKEELSRLAVTDKLTGLYNRRRFEEVLENELSRSRRFNHPFSLMIIDIDHFKEVNDSFGHDVGDRVLIEISKLIKENIRSTDVLVRWGGEEFVIICLETNLSSIKSIADNIRKKIESYTFKDIGNKTVSIGLTVYENDDTQASILKRADNALYKAKNDGRNRVEIIV